jgi:hypothetical protein
MSPAQHRVGDDDLERRPQPLAQRNRQRKAGEAAARDQDIDILATYQSGHSVPRFPPLSKSPGSTRAKDSIHAEIMAIDA